MKFIPAWLQNNQPKRSQHNQRTLDEAKKYNCYARQESLQMYKLPERLALLRIMGLQLSRVPPPHLKPLEYHSYDVKDDIKGGQKFWGPCLFLDGRCQKFQSGCYYGLGSYIIYLARTIIFISFPFEKSL